MLQVSPPDAHGFVSLGVSVDVVLAACLSARTVRRQRGSRRRLLLRALFYAMIECRSSTQGPLSLYPFCGHARSDASKLMRGGCNLHLF